MINIVSIRENPEYIDIAIKYFQSKWSIRPIIYEDSMTHCLQAENPLPQWYLLQKEGEIIGCAGLITNDFISRMDLYPWFCGLFVEEKHRGHSYATLLMEKAKSDALKGGFSHMYLCTDHIGYYEKYGFYYVGQGYHPWEEESRIYALRLTQTKEKQNTNFNIRQATKNDHQEIYDLIQTAFQTAKVKDGTEQDFAVQLRNSENHIPALELVAEKNGQLIGHIMFTKTYVKKPDATLFEALLVAPLSVLKEYRDLGVGSALMKEGFRIAKELGYTVAFLCGDPAYYHRFGFQPTTNFGIKMQGDIPQQYVLGCELISNALKKVTGTADFC